MVCVYVCLEFCLLWFILLFWFFFNEYILLITRTSQVVLVIKNTPANAGDIRDVSLCPGWGRSPEGGHGNPFQYSFPENPMDRGAWLATVHRTAKSQTWLKWLSTQANNNKQYYYYQTYGNKRLKWPATILIPFQHKSWKTVRKDLRETNTIAMDWIILFPRFICWTPTAPCDGIRRCGHR